MDNILSGTPCVNSKIDFPALSADGAFEDPYVNQMNDVQLFHEILSFNTGKNGTGVGFPVWTRKAWAMH